MFINVEGMLFLLSFSTKIFIVSYMSDFSFISKFCLKELDGIVNVQRYFPKMCSRIEMKQKSWS